MDKQDIIAAGLRVFEQKGIKFSVLDVAQELKTSKRTIYQHFAGKEDMMASIVDYMFEDIAKQHYEILQTEEDNLTKLKKILTVYPRHINVNGIDFDKMLEQDHKLYNQIVKYFNSNWDLTLSVLEDCQKQGLIKDLPKEMFKTIMLSIYEGTMHYSNNKEMLDMCIDVLFNGLQVQSK